MEQKGASTYPLAHKWFSFCLAIAFCGYWVFTFGVMLFGQRLAATVPKATFFYSSFARQSWRMFAFAKEYNRQMLFITRDLADRSKTDTTDLVQYLLAKKRGYAPFNNKQDAQERLLYLTMNGVESRLLHHEKKIKDTAPYRGPEFYRQRAMELVRNDTNHQQEINNIAGFARDMMQQEKKDTNGKEYQLIIKHKYIHPANPRLPVFPGSDEQLLFSSDYKPL